MSGKSENSLLSNQSFKVSLNDLHSKVESVLKALRDQSIIARIWSHDHSVWKPDPTEITNRLGWLHSPDVMRENIPEIISLVEAVKADGYTHALLLGMGGSSLAPEVFRFTYGVKPGFLDLAVSDSTDPGAVLEYANQLDPAKTLFIVSTKSGGTVETLSFFKYFYNLVSNSVGRNHAGEHFIAITDPGSSLEKMAGDLEFRKIFLNDPDIGGRYSVLSYFGLVPAALVGVDLRTLLDRAGRMANNCSVDNCPVAGDNTGVWLGAIMGVLAEAGRDKVTLVASPAFASFGAWAEQLIAESTGKEGKGIFPVDGEELGTPEVYGNDRLFVYLSLNDDNTYDEKVKVLQQAGHPVVLINLRDLYDLGGEFFRWEMATIVAGHLLRINPFDQPDVESAKVVARAMVAAYQEEGKLPKLSSSFQENGINVYTDISASSLEDVLNNFLNQTETGGKDGDRRSYIAIQAYVRPTHETDTALDDLRVRLRDKFKLATTVGYGPRFLHSTGQLHKGDAGHGLFIQITSDSTEDVGIPDEVGSANFSITFGVLKMTQALGDRQALVDTGRKVIRFHLATDVLGGLKQLEQALQ